MPLDFNKPKDEPILAIIHQHRRGGRRIWLTRDQREALMTVKNKKTIDDVIKIKERR